MALSESERAVFADMYHFYEKFAARRMDGPTFIEAANEWAILVNKHGNTRLAQDMFAAVYEHLGNRYKEELGGILQ